jgi:predicted nuclease of predicted toxin-antitoxin system
VKLLFDENLSRKLAPRLADLFPGSSYVIAEALIRTPDIQIWEYAKAHAFAIITADADFYELSTTLGPPPKVIWLCGCDYPTSAADL